MIPKNLKFINTKDDIRIAILLNPIYMDNPEALGMNTINKFLIFIHREDVALSLGMKSGVGNIRWNRLFNKYNNYLSFKRAVDLNSIVAVYSSGRISNAAKSPIDFPEYISLEAIMFLVTAFNRSDNYSEAIKFKSKIIDEIVPYVDKNIISIAAN